MPLGLENTTGTTIYVAAAEPSTYDAAGYGALAWEKVVGVVSFGEWGNQESDVSEALLSEDQVIHTNGVADGGTVSVSVQHRTTDAGAEILKTNGGTNTQVSILKVYASGEGEVATGIIQSPRYREASGNSIRGFTTTAMINTKVLPLTATEVTNALAPAV